MPTIPRRDPSLSPTAAPLPGVMSSTAAPSAAFGGLPTAPDVSGLESHVSQIVEREQQHADQIAVLDADNKLASLQDSLLNDPTTGVLNRKGENAFGAPETVNADWTKGMAEIEGGLTTQSQVEAFKRAAMARTLQLHETVQRHVAGEIQSYDQATSSAAVGNRYSDALKNYQNADAVKSNINETRAIITAYANRNGWSPEDVSAKTTDAESRIHVGVINQLLANDQDLAAAKYFTANKDAIAGDAQATVTRALEEGSVRGESQRQADLIVSGRAASGLITPGNIDLSRRPRVQNADGSVSTVRSISFEQDGKEILIPTVTPDGKVLSNDDAVARYQKTGQQLGVFQDAASADAYAEQLHQQQARGLTGGSTAPTLNEALVQVRAIADPKVRDATEERVRKYFTEQAEAQRQQREATVQSATNIVESTHDFNKIPPAMVVGFTLGERNSLREYAEKLTKGTPVETNWTTFYDLKTLASSDATRTKFLETNLLAYRPQLADADFKSLVDLQAEMRKGSAKAEEQLGGYRTSAAIVNDALASAGFDPTPAFRSKVDKDNATRVAMFRRTVDEQVRALEVRTGKKATTTDVQSIVDNQLVHGIRVDAQGKAQGQAFAFERQVGDRLIVSIKDVPPTEVAKIKSALLRRGLPTTDAAVIRTYTQRLGQLPTYQPPQ